MAIDGWTINGPAVVSVGTGSLGALETLGYTDGGVDVSVDELTADIISDVFGPLLAHDVQQFGMTAQITVPLVAMDRTVLGKVIGRGDRTTVGLLSTPGLTMGQSGYAFRVGIASTVDSPWSFSKCILKPGSRFKLATKVQPFTLTFFAGPFATYTVVSGKDTPIFTRSLS